MKSEELHRIAQPPTLASFLTWGSSAGADRIALTGRKSKSNNLLCNNVDKRFFRGSNFTDKKGNKLSLK